MPDETSLPANPLIHLSADKLKDRAVTYRDKPGVITLGFEDGTADVQLLDEQGHALRDENKQPVWYPRVPVADLQSR